MRLFTFTHTFSLYSLAGLLLVLTSGNGGAVQAAEATGYLVDKRCWDICQGVGPDQTCTPDNVNVLYNPEAHTGWCALLPACVNSGYILLSDRPGPEEDKHTIVLDLDTEQAFPIVLSHIQNGTNGMIPPVVVEYNEEDATLLEDGTTTQVNGNVIIRDHWDTDDSKYDDDITTSTYQVLCKDSTSPDIDKNNFCFRSNVVVTETSDGSVISIESNGCPDHVNMQGSSGQVTNLQEEEDSTNTAASAGGNQCGGCGGCGSACDSTCTAAGCCAAACCSAGCDSHGGCCAAADCASCAGCDAGNASCSSTAPCGSNCSAVCDGGDGPVASTGRSGRFLQDTTCNGCGSCCASESCGSGCNACSSNGCGGCCASESCGSGCNACSSNGCGSCCASESCGSGCNACSSNGCEGCCAAACCAATTCCGTCTVATNGQEHSSKPGLYSPMYQHYRMQIPRSPGTPGDAEYFSGDNDVVGILANGVLLDSHKATWSYDSCNGHSDKKHQYHYHIPPQCFLEKMEVAYPSETFWWKDGEQVREYSDMATQWPSTAAASPVIGFALDGYPIFGPYDESGVLQRGLDFGGDLDECNGKTDSNGNYGYYLTVDPPFAPPCLKGEKGVFSYHTTEKMCPKDGFDTRVLDTSSEACAGISFAEALTCGEEVVTADIGDDNSGVAYAGFTLALAMGVAVALLDVLAQV